MGGRLARTVAWGQPTDVVHSLNRHVATQNRKRRLDAKAPDADLLTLRQPVADVTPHFGRLVVVGTTPSSGRNRNTARSADHGRRNRQRSGEPVGATGREFVKRRTRGILPNCRVGYDIGLEPYAEQSGAQRGGERGSQRQRRLQLVAPAPLTPAPKLWAQGVPETGDLKGGAGAQCDSRRVYPLRLGGSRGRRHAGATAHHEQPTTPSRPQHARDNNPNRFQHSPVPMLKSSVLAAPPPAPSISDDPTHPSRVTPPPAAHVPATMPQALPLAARAASPYPPRSRQVHRRRRFLQPGDPGPTMRHSRRPTQRWTKHRLPAM